MHFPSLPSTFPPFPSNAFCRPKQEDSDELDSMMYQTVGHEVIDLYAEAMDLPLFRRDLEGSGLAIDKDYEPTQGDEVEDLFNLLKEVNDK